MKALRSSFFFIAILVAAAVYAEPVFSQAVKSGAAKPSIVVAVLSDGTQIEPITFIDKGKIVAEDEGAGKLPEIDKYFSPKRKFDLVFGGKRGGSVEVKKRLTGECAGTSAEVSVTSGSAKFNGFVMALATNLAPLASGPSSRRRPTASERLEIEKLVRTNFTKAGVAKMALQRLQYHNLTAVDLDSDGKAEFVGSFWIAPKSTERKLLFFIAEHRGSALVLSHSELDTYTPDTIMAGGEMSQLDEGVLHELLLDVLDYDADGVTEIFTTTQAFEGRNFRIYKRQAGKWMRVHESYNYRCAF